jgi:hypothetical protein
MAKERALSRYISHTSDELEKKSRPLAQRKFVVWELLAHEGLAMHGRTDLTFVNDSKNNNKLEHGIKAMCRGFPVCHKGYNQNSWSESISE